MHNAMHNAMHNGTHVLFQDPVATLRPEWWSDHLRSCPLGALGASWMRHCQFRVIPVIPQSALCRLCAMFLLCLWTFQEHVRHCWHCTLLGQQTALSSQSDVKVLMARYGQNSRVSEIIWDICHERVGCDGCFAPWKLRQLGFLQQHATRQFSPKMF